MSEAAGAEVPRGPATANSMSPRRDPVAPQIGVVGLGRMGTAFAKNLLADGYSVTVFDLSEDKRQLLGAIGAHPVPTLSGLASCAVVISSLPNDSALKAVALGDHGLVAILPQSAVHISMSTISPALSREVAEHHAHHGQGYVSAPVLGNPDLAQARKLFIIAAGDGPSVVRVHPLLDRLGQHVFLMGDDPGAANLMKLGGNVLTGLTIQGMGEVLALMRKGGIDGRKAFDVLTNSLFDAKVHKTYGGKIVDRRYSPAGMRAPLAVKDLRLALGEAEHRSVPMPATSLVHDRLVAMMARGWSDLDWSALGLLAAVDSGLEEGPPPNDDEAGQ